jgi:hypothetical protein
LAFHQCALEKAKTFTPPRTPSGKPDLQGYWRPAIAQAFSNEGVSGSEPLVGSLVMPWEKAPPMIVDPPDRKIPYQPWAVPIGRIGVNHNTYIDPRTACGSGGVPRVVLQDPNQILQPVGDQYVLWLFEDHHVQREIAMDGRPPLGGNIKVTNGDSRGRWDGNTLVIDVNNLNGYNWLDDSGNFYTDSAHLVERLTLIDPDTIHYEVRLEDPKVHVRGRWCGPRAREGTGVRAPRRDAPRSRRNAPSRSRRPCYFEILARALAISPEPEADRTRPEEAAAVGERHVRAVGRRRSVLGAVLDDHLAANRKSTFRRPRRTAHSARPPRWTS